MKGKLIVIEGACDGVGKSTQMKLLKDRLLSDGENVVSHHYPSYNEYYGVGVEKYLSGEYGDSRQLSPYFVNMLYAYDRAISWHKEFGELYNSNSILLFDRYTTSSIIYQSALFNNIDDKKNFINYVIDFEYNKLGIMSPDNVIFLYASFDIILKMINRRDNNDGIKNDIYERDMDYMRSIYDNAMFVADYLSWNMVKCDDDDQMKSIFDIHDKVYKLVKNDIEKGNN